MIPLTWKPVETRSDIDFVVAPDERLSWARTIGIGAQHVVAMFGATFLVPVLTGFPPTTTLLFSGVGTVLFLIIGACTLLYLKVSRVDLGGKK